MEILDMRFPAICVSRDNKNCVNVKIKFKVGCLQNFSSRRKRQTDPEENEVEIEVSGVDSEVEDNTTKEIHDSAVAIERAFYDSQVQEKTLNNNDIEYLGVDNVASVYEPVPGQGPLKSDGTPAGSVDLVSPGTSGFTYGPCPNGTYSTDGTECVSCAKNTYQDQTGQTSCKDCPGKTFTTSTGAKAESQCGKLKTNTIAIIVGISGGVAAFLLLLIAGGLSFWRYRRRHNQQGTRSSEVFDNGNHNQQGIDSPEVPDSTNYNQRNSSHSDYKIPVSNHADENHNQQGIGSPDVADFTNYNHSDYEIPDSSPAEVCDIEASSQPENVYLDIYDHANNSEQGHFYESLNCSYPNFENGHRPT
ncbi:uncharacterized protein [Littorina saxatilis]|uniref:uncharacterized protein n=1 Tax=Littorina saxatilis TaxID=31220 RepID=UPI0038B618C5